MAITETNNQSARSCTKKCLERVNHFISRKKSKITKTKRKQKQKPKTNLVDTPENTEVSQKRLNPPSSAVKYLASC